MKKNHTHRENKIAFCAAAREINRSKLKHVFTAEIFEIVKGEREMVHFPVKKKQFDIHFAFSI